MTSCFVSASISSMRSIWNAPRSHTARAADAGAMPSAAMASSACASISNQMRNLASADQTAAISARV